MTTIAESAKIPVCSEYQIDGYDFVYPCGLTFPNSTGGEDGEDVIYQDIDERSALIIAKAHSLHHEEGHTEDTNKYYMVCGIEPDDSMGWAMCSCQYYENPFLGDPQTLWP